MDPQRFDALTRALATPRSRRRFLGGLAAVAGLVGIGPSSAAAASCRETGGLCREHGNCCTGVCLPPDRYGRRKCAKGLGDAATSGTECASGIVADGVCCDGACGGQCEGCNLSGAAGTCSPVSGAPANGHAACGGSGACTGFCDGANRTSCAFPNSSTVCGSPTCDTGSGQATVYICNGSGTCTASISSCGLYVCGGSSCKATCSSDADCIGAAYCAGGTCQADKTAGESCTSRDQCQSGLCVDGVCCTVSSCGECQRCSTGGVCGADASQEGSACSVGICLNGICGCPGGQRFCDGSCGAYECCADTDCGFDAVCQKAICNLTTHTCQVVNTETDSRCVTDLCTTRSCSNGVCHEVGQLSVCSTCEDFVSPCNPAVGPQCTPKVCNTPGPCQDGPGVCAGLGCVYTDRCADCQTCQNGACVDNCPPGVVSCKPTGVCNTTSQICDYADTCGPCAFCDPGGVCREYPDGHHVSGTTVATCCDGQLTVTCSQGTCPVAYEDRSGNQLLCCGTVIGNSCCDGIEIEGECCPPGTMYVCSGSFGGAQCCDHECSCPPLAGGCICA